MTKSELEQLEQTRMEISTSLGPVLTAASAIVINDQDGYSAADLFLSKIRIAKHRVQDKLGPIIEPIRKGLDELYALKRDLDRPLIAAEDDIKNKMSRYKLEEARRLAQAEAQRKAEEETLRQAALAAEREAHRLAIEAANEERRQSAARSESERLKSQLHSGELKARQDAAMAGLRQLQLQEELKRQQRREAAVRAENSKARRVKKWRVTDFQAFVMAVAVGDIPLDCLQLDEVIVNGYFKTSVEAVAAYPGVEVYDDVVIAGR